VTSVSQTKSTTRATFDVPWWKKYRKLADLRVSDKLLNESTIFSDSQIPQISRVVAHAKNQLDPSSHFKRTSWQADGETQDHGTYCHVGKTKKHAAIVPVTRGRIAAAPLQIRLKYWPWASWACPSITSQQCPFPWGNRTPKLIIVSWDPTSAHPKQYRDWLSYFCKNHSRIKDSQTDHDITVTTIVYTLCTIAMQRNNTNRIAGWSLLEPWQTKGAMCWHNCWHSLALDCQTASPVLSRNVQTHQSPLKLRPYGAIQICLLLLLLLIHMHHASIFITAAQQHGSEREKYKIENQYEV